MYSVQIPHVCCTHNEAQVYSPGPCSSVEGHVRSLKVRIDFTSYCVCGLIHTAEKLKNSKYGTPDSLDHITKRFDETTKRLFRDNKETQFVPFGSPLDKDLSVGVRSGQLKLTG